jgi:3-dehydroquinate synthase
VARVTVAIPRAHYPVLVGRGAIQELPRLARDLGVTAAAMIVDSSVGEFWAQPVQDGLTGGGIRTEVYSSPAGEQSKSFDELERVLEFLERSEIDRRGLLVALGGGRIGDLAGFAAAVWLRGIRYVHVPTTLLAMVDSSVGGKTGINSARAKNAVGAFWQPCSVLSDLATLDTLPETEYLSAFGEVVKYAVAMDRELGERLEGLAPDLLRRSGAALEPVVARCVELKAKVVASDEREAGPRAILNYGHTVGHALESASAYSAMHGRAVAMGMRAAAGIAAEMGLCDRALLSSQEALLRRFDLPGALPQVSAEAVLAAISRDKKSVAGSVRWVLPREMGSAQIGVSVPPEVVARVVRALLP